MRILIDECLHTYLITSFWLSSGHPQKRPCGYEKLRHRYENYALGLLHGNTSKPEEFGDSNPSDAYGRSEVTGSGVDLQEMTDSYNQLALFPGVAEIEWPRARVRRQARAKQPFMPFDPSDGRYSRLVLASASPSKYEILTRLGLNFEIDPANIDEKSFKTSIPEILVRELAAAKGSVVKQRHPDDLVLAADTVIISNGNVVGKPLDRMDALRILSDLNGRTHSVLTGLVVFDGSSGRCSSRVVTTRVRFRTQSREALVRYVSTGEPMGKAGAYALQGMGALMVEEVSGEYTNVLGLPVCAFLDALNELGYELI